MPTNALEHLENAETTILNWWSRLDDGADDDGIAELEFTTMLAAVLRSVSRAAGVLQGMDFELVEAVVHCERCLCGDDE